MSAPFVTFPARADAPMPTADEINKALGLTDSSKQPVPDAEPDHHSDLPLTLASNPTHEEVIIEDLDAEEQIDSDNSNILELPSCSMFGLLPEKTLARILGFSLATLSSWRKANKGPKHLIIGKRVFYRVADIAAWIESIAARS